MISELQTPPIDLDLVDQVCERIPNDTWTMVRNAIVANVVDNMPSDVLLKLTGEPDNFDRAEEIVMDYYRIPERNQELIVDSFKILGPENTLYLLDSLQLDKYVESRNESEVDLAPSSVDPD